MLPVLYLVTKKKNKLELSMLSNQCNSRIIIKLTSSLNPNQS